jgi:ABC-type dipeptide/oligopeptide/nickel transport system permease subunit
VSDPADIAAASQRHTGGLGDPPSISGSRLDALAGATALPIAAPMGVSLRRDAWRRFRRNKLAMVGLGIVVLLIVVAIAAPLVARQDPLAISSKLRQPPSADHWFGTDAVGRDLFARVIFGARVSLTVGILSSLIATIIGVLVGASAGFYGRWLDALLMRFTDILLAFPYFILAVAIITIVGRGQWTVILVLGLTGWLGIARVLRSSFLQLKEMEFIEASRAVGVSNLRIIVRHLLPNAIQPVIVYATLAVGTAVLAEAALSFVGAGITEPTPSWGLMVNQGRKFVTSAPHLLLFPGGAIFIMVLSFLFIGDGLRDALDPKLR